MVDQNMNTPVALAYTRLAVVLDLQLQFGVLTALGVVDKSARSTFKSEHARRIKT